jgi:purine nucleoside permease
LVPGIDLSATYVIITGTGGVNPKYGTAGGVAISQYSIQLEWLSMFLGSDLPANFSSQYMYAYAQASPFEYPSLVGSEVYELNTALVDRIAAISTDLEFEDVDSDLQRLRQTYLFEAARKAPFLAHCDVVSSQIYWHGDVAGHNVEVYANIVTSGVAKPCNTNQDDQGRLLGLAGAAEAGLLDFSRVAMIKAFSNFDRPPPQLSAYQSRYYVGEAATGPGLRNAWSVIRGVVADVLEHWEDVYEDGISAPNYVGDAKGTLGGTPPFVQNSTAVAGSVQGA